ncbi:ribonuclease HII [Rhodothalassium salexigens]|uniref:ribonuclease HII n=1 Tax=Rhodothalassium salexigens TaxID=1086 RepID=UPI00191189E2|nr:ribonuclease HII [Rhodothalassium salexigens]MBK5911364.1 ribonuclease HII [Rhodothalassium salexigens]MBK5921876.1 ribonuclease HII [Rhodothalassium salexigens]
MADDLFSTDGAARPRTGKEPPDFRAEAALAARFGGGLVAGVDEAGRGPLAGPVVAAAVVFADPADAPPGIADSKKLTKARREALAQAIKARAAAWAVAEAGVDEIDRINILAAAMAAMARAVRALDPAPAGCLIDGNRVPEGLVCPAEALVKGDARSVSVAAASILAKVERDRIMAALDAAEPAYGWARNAGYGVPAHLEALRLVGPSVHHRRSFRPVADAIAAKLSTSD